MPHCPTCKTEFPDDVKECPNDHTKLVDAYPQLSAYKRRCEARPAFQRAMQAQMEGFKNAA